jgi:hypothetical protein
MPYRLYLCLMYSTQSPLMSMQHMHQHDQQWYDLLHFIMWPYWFINLDFTCSSPLLRSISVKSSLNLPFTLVTGPSSQVMSWSSPPWSHDSMSCLMCNELLHRMCDPCNKFKLSSPSWHVLLTHMYLWTNHLCISLKHILVHIRLSLNYQNQIRTFQTQGDFFWRSNAPGGLSSMLGVTNRKWGRPEEAEMELKARKRWWYLDLLSPGASRAPAGLGL